MIEKQMRDPFRGIMASVVGLSLGRTDIEHVRPGIFEV
jgi:hypothetical protein